VHFVCDGKIIFNVGGKSTNETLLSLSSQVSIMRPESLNSWEQNGAPSPRVYLHSFATLTFSKADTVVMYFYTTVPYTASHVYRVDSTIRIYAIERVRGLLATLESRAPFISDYTLFIYEGSYEYIRALRAAVNEEGKEKENETLSSRDRIARRELARFPSSREGYATRDSFSHVR